jgi:hypothetical protein
MIKNFLIINCIGRNDKIGLKVIDKFFIHDFNSEIKEKDQLVTNILNLIKKHKVNLDNDFSILVNSGPGRFSSIRISLAVAKGIKLTKKIKLFGYKDRDLGEFCLANIELLIKNDLLQNNLIKPLYLS